MRCSRCGAFLEDGAAFCGRCGAPITKKRSLRKRKKYLLIFAIIFILIILAVAGLTVKHFILQDNADHDGTNEMKSIIGETQDELSSSDEENSENKADESVGKSETADPDDSSFHIDADTEEDYSKNLNPDEYAFYDSGISDFNFYYPTELYQEVKIDNDPSSSTYGTRIQKVHFTGSKGSELIFEICEREDSLSLDSMREKVFQTESNVLSDPVTILNRLGEGKTHGKVIISGYNESSHKRAVYDMTKIEDEYILQMKVLFPFTPEDDENNRQQNYVVDCLYRLCGFSDTSYESTRSYDEFCESLKSN